jgi:[ribosomal protein S5]-alanine N-acetyltransferase
MHTAHTAHTARTAARPIAADARELPTLAGERVHLRWLAGRDVPAIFSVFGDPIAMRYWSTPALADERGAEVLLRDIHDRFHARTTFQWGIARRADDGVIGTVSLYQLDFAHRRSELGFALDRAHWGQGLATEAVRLAIAFAFGALDFGRLEADVDPRNLPSLRVLERLGFAREGYLRERYHVNGETQDSVLLGLLRREWDPTSGRRER